MHHPFRVIVVPIGVGTAAVGGFLRALLVPRRLGALFASRVLQRKRLAISVRISAEIRVNPRMNQIKHQLSTHFFILQ